MVSMDRDLSKDRADPVPGGTKYFCFIQRVDIENHGDLIWRRPSNRPLEYK